MQVFNILKDEDAIYIKSDTEITNRQINWVRIFFC